MKNFKSLHKQIKLDNRSCKDVLYSLIIKVNIVRLTTYQKQSRDSTQSPPKLNHNSLQTFKGNTNFHMEKLITQDS